MAGRTTPPSAANAAQDAVRVEIKKESPEDEIKEYAETAMNELLGWYGYEKLDSQDTQGLDLHHFASVSKHARRHLSNRLPGHHHVSPRSHLHPSALAPHLPPPPPLRPPPHRPTRHTVRTTLTKLPLPTLVHPPPAAPKPVPPPPLPTERQGDADASPSSSSSSTGGVSGAGVEDGSPKVKRECTDTPPAAAANSSICREDAGMDSPAVADTKYTASSSSSGSPQSPESHAGAESQPPLLCSWCGRPAGNLPITAPSTTTTLSLRNGGSSSVTSTTTKAFCSEVCFTQCRRASFKRSKACDWCRHVRHTVAYVDFQDGETQLQFCSDKCLNQYKMNIFCRETQAHLAQLKAEASGVASAVAGTSGGGTGGGGPPLIITPDLWLRDCRERVEGEEGDGGRDEGSGESHEEEEGEEEGVREEGGMVEEVEEEEEPEGSPRRPPPQKRILLVAESLAVASKGSKKKASSKERLDRRRKKRRKHAEDIPPSTPSSAAALFQQIRPPLGVQPLLQRMPGPRKTPPPLTHHPAPPSGLVPHPLGPSPFLPPHLPPHLPSPQIPLHLLPPIPEAHFPRFLHPQSESLHPSHVLPPSHPPLLPRVPSLQLPPHQPPSLLPPVTMLIPYPIILPIPVPIPIPIPVLGSALFKRFAEEKRKEARGIVSAVEAVKEEQQQKGNLTPSAPISPRSSSSPPLVTSPHPLEAPDDSRERSLSERKMSRGPSMSVTEEEGPVMENKRKFVPA